METHFDMNDLNGILHDAQMQDLSVTFQDSVLVTPPARSRAGLFIYITSMLQDKPSFDDNRVINLLSFRYGENISDIISDFVFASFDVLANVIFRNSSKRNKDTVRSFIVNKVPVFIAENYVPKLSGDVSPEKCLRQASRRISSLSQQSYDILSETHVDFLFACALHGLIPESKIKDILGDTSLQGLPPGGRYTKESINNDIKADTCRIEHYAAQLENFEGNSNAIAQAIVEIMRSMCSAKDTMSLKIACNALSCRPTALDVIQLFAQADTLLKPLLQLLDDWPESEDQSEHRDMYEEFGSILLFIYAMRVSTPDFNSGSFYHMKSCFKCGIQPFQSRTCYDNYPSSGTRS